MGAHFVCPHSLMQNLLHALIKTLFAFRKKNSKDVTNGSKKGKEFVHKFFDDDPIGKQIAKLANNWNKTVLKGRF